MNTFNRLLRIAATASLFIAPVSYGAVVDDFRVAQLEQEVRELQRLVRQQANRIDALENSLRQPRANVAPVPERAAVKVPNATRWLDIENWSRVKTGMEEAEVLRLLGPPTSKRPAQGENSQILFYAMELDTGGFLSGQVVVREQHVVDVQRPALK